MTSAKPVPDFKSEAEEREFWDSSDLTDVIPEQQWKKNKAKKGPTTTFAVRLDQQTVDQIREIAGARGIGATQLARAWILDRMKLELAAGELANPDADERELQIRRAVMDDVALNISDVVLGALAAFGIGAAVGKAASKATRSASQAGKRTKTPAKGSATVKKQESGTEIKEAKGA